MYEYNILRCQIKINPPIGHAASMEPTSIQRLEVEKLLSEYCAFSREATMYRLDLGFFDLHSGI